MDEDEATLAAEGLVAGAAGAVRGGAAELGPGSSRDAAAAAAANSKSGSNQRSSKRKKVYEQHKLMSEITAGIAAGRCDKYRCHCFAE